MWHSDSCSSLDTCPHGRCFTYILGTIQWGSDQHPSTDVWLAVLTRPQWLSLPHSQPYVVPSPWVWAGPSNLLLMKRMWPKQWTVTSVIRLQKTRHFADVLSSAFTWQGRWARNWGCHPTNSYQGTEAFSLTAWEDLNPADSLSELGIDVGLVEAWDDCDPGWHLDHSLATNPETEVS